MQTFLPFAEFDLSAIVLDDSRLNKQTLEVYQILNVLKNPIKTCPLCGGDTVLTPYCKKCKGQGKVQAGWSNHTAVVMWRHYHEALVHYGIVMCQEWITRGHTTANLEKIEAFATGAPIILPPWIGDETIHESHRANLIRKDLNFYRGWGFTEEPENGYLWPVVEDPASGRYIVRDLRK